MRQFIVHSLAASAISAALAFSSAPAIAKTIAECNAEFAANKDAIKASGQTKKDYVAACRAGSATTPAATTPETASAPAPQRDPARRSGRQDGKRMQRGIRSR